jgi:hypothetical protein
MPYRIAPARNATPSAEGVIRVDPRSVIPAAAG